MRSFVHHALFVRSAKGLSSANTVIAGMIVLACIVTVLETEHVLTEIDWVATTFLTANIVFAAFFTVEYLVRVWAAGEDKRYAGLRGRLRYMVTPIALIDLLAILPYLLSFGTNDLVLLRVFRFARLLQLARIGGFIQAGRLVIEAVRERSFELVFSFVIAFFILMLGAIGMYLVEAEAQPENFGSIPRAMWWAVATLTTVGYGDVYPVTPIGKLLASLTAVAGIGVIAMPAGILAAAFSDAFQKRKASRSGNRKQRKPKQG